MKTHNFLSLIPCVVILLHIQPVSIHVRHRSATRFLLVSFVSLALVVSIAIWCAMVVTETEAPGSKSMLILNPFRLPPLTPLLSLCEPCTLKLKRCNGGCLMLHYVAFPTGLCSIFIIIGLYTCVTLNGFMQHQVCTSHAWKSE